VQAKTQERARRVEVTVTSNQVLLALACLFFLNLLLRVFYIRYDFVNGDEGVRALTAVRMLEGARLYADVVTDKPPGASLFYAEVFAVFGRSMKAVHVAATVWNFGTSVVVYLIASQLYNKRIGLWAALLFVYFSTNYFTQDTMAANTELLMAMPYAAAFYFFMVSDQADKKGSEHFAYIPLIAAGLLTGLATLFKQIGVLNLAFFALYEVLSAWKARSGLAVSIRQCIARLSLIAVGFGVVLAGVAVWLKSMHALGDFWRNAFMLNMFYIDSEPANLWVKFMLGRGLGFIFFNATLWTLAVWAAWRSLRTDRERRKDVVDESDHAIALWCGVSLVAVIISGRFYGHYFIPALPGLSLLAAHGVQLLRSALVEPAYRRRARVGLAMLGVLFSIGLVRCHHRTAVLAYETATGTRTEWSANWGMTKREQEAEVVSEYVRQRISPGDPLYIWGYAHDVYWRTGCRPASRYLTPYFIDGRFADAEATVSSSGAELRAEAAANLLDDLQRNKPGLILDVEGNFKSLPYADLVDFIDQNYRYEGNAGLDPSRPFHVLRLKTQDEKQQEEIERLRKKERKRLPPSR
jgi:4-amino-4-deoxy-L-arabinose transferase-like glycosyltransferase